MIATATPQDLRAAPDTAGKPAGGTEIRILDNDFNEVPTGEVGSIYVPQLHAVRRLHLGQHQGLPRRLHVVGRCRLPRRGRPAVRGRPRRRDDRLRRRERLPHRGGEDAGRAPRRRRGLGDRGGRRTVRSAACRVRGSESTARRPPPTTLKQHVRENLANYKVPREITVLDELPRSITGKIVRSELQDAGRPCVGAGRCCARRRSCSTLPTACGPLGREGYVTIPVFAFGWPTTEMSPLYMAGSVLDAARRGLRGDFASRGAESPCCSRSSPGACCV